MTGLQSLVYWIAAGLGTPDSSKLFLGTIDVEAALNILRQHSEIVWLLPLLATAGSLLVAGTAFWIGRKIGANALGHWVSPALLQTVRDEVRHQGTVALVLPSLLPPPFPLLPFLLAYGALSVSATRFFVMFGGLRLARSSILTALGWFYGRQILNMFETGTLKIVLAIFVAVILISVGTTFYRIAASIHRRHMS